MDRKFVIALSSLAGSLMLSEAHAIGLGEIRLRSALNEPLRADIKLVQVNDLSENEIIVGLAPKEDFDRAHVDKDFLLNSLRFRLDLDDPKNPKVVVTTQQPLREPFLNFLVEVQWPSGRLLREYTLLMDLPAFSDNRKGGAIKQATVPSGRAQLEDEGVSELEPKPVKAPAPRVTAPKAQSAGVPVRRASPSEVESHKGGAVATEKEAVAASDKVSAADNTYGPTDSSDTMWRIAQGVRGSGSVQQKILAIQRLNPGAFGNGNVNLLKKGQILKLPSQEEIASIGKAEATARFNEQNTAWKTGAKPTPAVGAQLDATGRAQAQAPAAAQPDGQLKLAAPAASAAAGQATQGAGGQPGAEVAALQNDLAVGMEELNRVQRENEEIASRAKDLDAQKENAERLLKLQSDEMAAMQAKLAAEQQAKAAADAAAAQSATDAQAAADAQAKAAADAAAQAAADAQAKIAADAAAAQAAADAEAKAAADAQAKIAADAAAAQAAADAEAKAAADAAAAQAAADAQAKAAADAAAAQAEGAQTPPVTEAVPAVEPALVPEAVPAAEPAPVAETASTPEEAVAPVSEATAPAVQIAPPAAESAPESGASSLVDTLKSNPIIGGIVAVVLIMLALVGIRRRAGRPSEEAEEGADESLIEYVAPQRDELEQRTEGADASESEDELDTDWDLDAAAEEADAVSKEPSPSAQSETGDVLGEADIYISFGNFDKGETLLKSAIGAEPARTDYRLKLLELYKESGNLVSFDEAYKGLIDLDDDVAIARAGELRAGVAGAASTPFSFGVSSAAAAEGIADEHEFDLDLDMDFDTPAEAHAELEPVAQAVAAEPEAEESTFFDVDFDLDAEPGFASDATEIHKAVSVAASPASVDALEEEFSLDFDLDLETPVVQAEPELVIPEATPAATEQEYTEEENAMLGAVTADAGEIDEELGFLSDADESATKLDLARAYIDMGDKDGARDILAEVLEEGRSEQKREAQALLDSIG